MVVGSLAFAALRRVPLRALLFFSTLAIGVAYLGTAISPTLAVACAASFVGGLGNGIQWIALVTAVQELTRADYQARVLALLEALASAMPGIGFLIGGAIAAIFEPRLSFAVAGAGVLCVLALAAGLLRRSRMDARSSSRAAAGWLAGRCKFRCRSRTRRARRLPVPNAPLVSRPRRVPCKSAVQFAAETPGIGGPEGRRCSSPPGANRGMHAA